MEEVREEGTVYVHATGAKECAVGVCMCYRAVRGDLREGGVEGAGGTVGALPGRQPPARPVLQASWPLLVSLLRRHPEGPLGTD